MIIKIITRNQTQNQEPGKSAIKTKEEYQQYLDRVDELFERKVSHQSHGGEELRAVLLLIKDYEDAHFPIPPFLQNSPRTKLMGHDGKF